MLDQKGCIYMPRVLGVRAGQPVKILNSDPTMHNVHSLPMANQEMNQSKPVRGFRERQTFTAPEVMVRFMCNVHSWMAAYVGVVAHPFFAVTDADRRVRAAGRAAGHLHGRSVAREVRASNRARDDRRPPGTNGFVHLQSGQ